MRRVVSRSRGIVIGAVFGFIGLTGILKLFDLSAFADSLTSWTVLPALAKPILTISVPTLEIVLALAWFSDRRRILMESIALGFLICATTLYAVQSVLSEPPDCGCLGLLHEYQDQLSSVHAMIWRNGTLMLLLMSSLVTRLCYAEHQDGPESIYDT